MNDREFSDFVRKERDNLIKAGIDTSEKARRVYDAVRLRGEMHLPQIPLSPEFYASLVTEGNQ